MPNDFRYFSGETELEISYPLKNEVVRSKFPAGKIKRYDSFSLQVGTVSGKHDPVDYLPVTRIICYNTKGSRHKCVPVAAAPKAAIVSVHAAGSSTGSIVLAELAKLARQLGSPKLRVAVFLGLTDGEVTWNSFAAPDGISINKFPVT